MNRRTRALIGSLAALGTLFAASAGPALASPSSESAAANSYTSCPTGYFCIYTAPNYGGTMYKTNHNVENLPSGIINNDASFVDNTGAAFTRLYYGPGYGNPHTCISDSDEGPEIFPNLLTPVHYYFNSNETPGDPTRYVYHDVHGLTIDSTVCTALMVTE